MFQVEGTARAKALRWEGTWHPPEGAVGAGGPWEAGSWGAVSKQVRSSGLDTGGARQVAEGQGWGCGAPGMPASVLFSP